MEVECDTSAIGSIIEGFKRWLQLLFKDKDSLLL